MHNAALAPTPGTRERLLGSRDGFYESTGITALWCSAHSMEPARMHVSGEDNGELTHS